MRTNLRFSLHSAHFFSDPSHAIPCTKYHQDCLMLALTQKEHETFKALNNHHPYIETVVTADEVDEDWYLDTIIVYI